jgi:hypothetical protein
LANKLPDRYEDRCFIYPDGSRICVSDSKPGMWYGKTPDGVYLKTTNGYVLTGDSPLELALDLEAAGYGPPSLPRAAEPPSEPKACHACSAEPIPGIYIADDAQLPGIGPWVLRCEACGLYEDDLAALNAWRLEHDMDELTTGYPFSLVDADWGEPVEQRFIVKIEASITIRQDIGDSLGGVGDLRHAIAANFLDWISAATDDTIVGMAREMEVESADEIHYENEEIIGRHRP